MKGQTWRKPVAVLVAWVFSLTQAAPLAYAQHALRPSGTRGNAGAQLFTADSALSQALRPYIDAMEHGAAQLAAESHVVEVRAVNRGPQFVSALEAGLQERVPGGAVRVEGDQVVLTVSYEGAEGNPLLDRTLFDLVRDAAGSLPLHRGGMIPVDQLRGQIAAARGGDAEAVRFLRAYAADNPEEFKAQLVELSEDPAALEQQLLRATLRATAARMVPPTGGILAADEGAGKPEADGVIRKLGTAGRRLASVGLPETPANRQTMRRVLLTTPGLKAAGIDAVILDRDTLTNTVADEDPTTLVEHLKAQGIIPGLKTDEGLKNAPNAPDGSGLKEPNDPEHTKLPALLARANELGLGFTKYRTTVPGSGAPEDNIRLNAQVQAHQAKLTQDAGLVPIVEPEVVFDGSDGSPATHTLAESEAATTRMLDATFEALQQAGVWLDGMVLKTSMVLAGKNFPDKAAPQPTDPGTVGDTTLKVLLKTVPKEAPAIVFLSGGQADDQGTANLDAVARTSQTRFADIRDAAVAELRAEGKTARAEEVAALTAPPWQLSYSFGRGLQAPALKAWGGKPEQVAAAQTAMQATARTVQAARQGRLVTATDLATAMDQAADSLDSQAEEWQDSYTASGARLSRIAEEVRRGQRSLPTNVRELRTLLENDDVALNALARIPGMIDRFPGLGGGLPAQPPSGGAPDVANWLGDEAAPAEWISQPATLWLTAPTRQLEGDHRDITVFVPADAPPGRPRRIVPYDMEGFAETEFAATELHPGVYVLDQPPAPGTAVPQSFQALESPGPVQAFIEEAQALGITADAKRLEAAFWSPALPELSTTVVSPQVARSHARLTHPFWAVIHTSVYDVPGSDAVQARLLDQLETLRERAKDRLPQGIEIPELLRQGALRVAIVVEGAATAEAAEAYRQRFLAEFHLPEEFIRVGLPEAWSAEDAAEIEAALLAEAPGSIVGSLVGPSVWLDRLAAPGSGSALVDVAQVPFDAPGAGKLAAAGNAIAAGIEVAARRAEVAVAEAEGRQPPAIPGRLDVFRELGLPQEHELVDPQMEQAIAERRQRIRAVQVASVGGV